VRHVLIFALDAPVEPEVKLIKAMWSSSTSKLSTSVGSNNDVDKSMSAKEICAIPGAKSTFPSWRR